MQDFECDRSIEVSVIGCALQFCPLLFFRVCGLSAACCPFVLLFGFLFLFVFLFLSLSLSLSVSLPFSLPSLSIASTSAESSHSV